MLMENFMNGFPGRECQIRGALLEVLGQEKCEYFFDKFLEYFFTEKDAQFLASLGFNSLRLPLNYHHFEDDMNPMVIKEEGFKHVDRVVKLVSSEVHVHESTAGPRSLFTKARQCRCSCARKHGRADFGNNIGLRTSAELQIACLQRPSCLI